MNIFNNVILARNTQLSDDDRMIETCRSVFKSFNINNLSVCIGWCTDQVTMLLLLLLLLFFNYSIFLSLLKPTAYTVRTETSKRMTGLLANISVHISKVIFQLHSLFSYFSFIKACYEISYHKIFSS